MPSRSITPAAYKLNDCIPAPARRRRDGRLHRESRKYAKIDELVESPILWLFVIPVITGIQYLLTVKRHLDSRLRGNEDFVQAHEILRRRVA